MSLSEINPRYAAMEDQVADATAIFRAAVRGVRADQLLNRSGWMAWPRKPLASYRRLVVAGMGKAAAAMAGAVEQQLGAQLAEGVVVAPRGASETLPEGLPLPRRIQVLEGAHPVPDETSVRAARRVLEVAGGCGAEDLLLVLLSGGGTALCADFVEGIALDDAQQTFRLLLEGGADIYAMNTVRKHLSRVGGGRLARAAAPADVLALVISDVVGDDVSVIASGPTTPDPTTAGDAIAVLHRYGLWEKTPLPVRKHLEGVARDPGAETPKPGEGLFEGVRTELIGTNRDALQAARAEAQRRGYAAHIVADDVTGEAREVGVGLVREAFAARDRHARQEDRPLCLLWGGETTVTVWGGGRGGRNQEMVLAAALALEGSTASTVFLSGGTDGQDGPTPAAGAWATPQTARAARQRGLVPERYLERNDAYAFFEALQALVVTGPTHTNVMDVQVALVKGDHA